MQVKSNPNKQANGVVFPRNPNSHNFSYPPVRFSNNNNNNNNNINNSNNNNDNNNANCNHQRHLQITLGSKLNFNIHFDQKI